MSQQFTLIQVYHEIIKAYHMIIQVPPPKVLIKSAKRVIKLVKIISNLGGEKKRQKLPSTKDLREALHLLGFEEITEPRETQPSEKSEKEKALGCKKGSMIVCIYIYIQKYGLDIIYHTVYGLHYMLYFYNVVPELYQLFIPSLCL